MTTAASSSAPTVKTLLGIWALFLAFTFVQLGNGIQRVLLPIRGESEGFTPSTMGFVMAFHFAGYLMETENCVSDIHAHHVSPTP